MDVPEAAELRPAAAIPAGDGWLYEPKWDGFRCLAVKDGETVTLRSKHGKELERYFPEVVAALRRFAPRRAVLDGELVVPVAGALSFDALQQRIHPAASRVRMLAERTPAWYLAFDALALGDESLRDAPLRDRRAALERAAEAFPHPTLRRSPATTDLAVVRDWFGRVGGALDGVVAKPLAAAYPAGTREYGLKIKERRTADCVVGGYRAARDDPNAVASLLLGLYDEAGRLDYIGFCSAFPAAKRRALLPRLAPLAGGAGFTGGAPGDTPSRWNRGDDRERAYVALAPSLVLEVAFDQVTGGRIRHGTTPVRWRPDKDPRACGREQLATPNRALVLLD